MASRKKEDSISSIKKYKNRREFNIGILLFAVIFLYLVITVILSLTKEPVSVYEVREGSIVKDNTYTGLVIREESVVYSDSAGYVSYYQSENSKVKAGSNIYVLSSDKLEIPENTPEEASHGLTEEILSGMVLQIQNFNLNYTESDFTSVYSLKNDLTNTLQTVYKDTKTQKLGALVEANGMSAVSYQSMSDGIVSFSVDGYESITKESFTEEQFDRSQYENSVFSDQMKIKAGDPVYKMITGEKWSIIVKLPEDTAQDMETQEISSVKVRIGKDSETMWAHFSVIRKDGNTYGCLDFDDSMIRYAEDRYLSVELILEDESGLKIPKSSVTTNPFYVIPLDYITKGGNSSYDGVMLQDESGSAAFQTVHIFSSTEEEAYISPSDIDDGSVIVKPDSSETYQIRRKKDLSGVYNINKGYAVFKKVTILCENDEYYIVQEGEYNGLYNFDHIVLNGNTIEDNQVVFQ